MNKLDVGEFTAMITKSLKNILQFEQIFPPNNVVQPFKEKVELMKNRLPVITYLKNDNLRMRHWQQIAHLLNHDLKKEKEVTLTLLEEINAFKYKEELKDISFAASSEYSLEVMLNKIEKTWLSLEFIVLQHKDNKDVYILGSLEEIHTMYDDSFIAIQTIAASKYVEPIKHRVDDWIEKLNLFLRTLVNCKLFLIIKFCINVCI